MGLPLFGTLIAYLQNGEPRVGVIGAHALHETVYAARGLGCWYHADHGERRRIQTSAVTELAGALVVSTAIEHTDLDPLYPNPSVRLSRLYQQARRFRWSGDCINYALVCQGRIDVALDPRMNPWDIAAVAPCVREAGGVLTSLDGNEDVVWQPNLVASANPALHAKVLESLRT
jgi:histidinol-phosphatase